jgi:prenyltransferase beta subunit
MFAAARRACAWLERSAKERIIAFAAAQQRPDGGFGGRDGAGSDLYYTVFGAAVLDILGQRRRLKPLRGYVKSIARGGDLDFVHLVCLARLHARTAPWGFMTRRRILDAIESYRSADGGYHHARQNAAHGTPYAAFLATLACTDYGRRPVPRREALLESLKASRTPDGAYANEVDASTGHTNATAAAVLVRHYSGLDADPALAEWLMARHDARGGFLANPHAPIPDLLSTATALFALQAMDVSLDAIREVCTEFVELLWQENGGFSGHLVDDTPDCEYTFYALLALGVLG